MRTKALFILCMLFVYLSSANSQVYVFKTVGTGELSFYHFKGDRMRCASSSNSAISGDHNWELQKSMSTNEYSVYSCDNPQWNRVNYRKISKDLKRMECYAILYNGNRKNSPSQTLDYIVSGNNESTSSSTSSSSSSTSSNSNNRTTIVVEHQHTPQPVQEWQACFGCGGMGTMGCTNCGGSGTKYIGDRLHRCSRCNGQGIIPCNICYGNKGKYVTVYR